jgi:hypothetical protein
MVLRWELVDREWVLRGYSDAGYAVYLLSPSGPPFEYRTWDKVVKQWRHFTLDHVHTLEEARLCIAAVARMM